LHILHAVLSDKCIYGKYCGHKSFKQSVNHFFIVCSKFDQKAAAHIDLKIICGCICCCTCTDYSGSVSKVASIAMHKDILSHEGPLLLW